jgi:hypothetical protein
MVEFRKPSKEGHSSVVLEDPAEAIGYAQQLHDEGFMLVDTQNKVLIQDINDVINHDQVEVVSRKIASG